MMLGMSQDNAQRQVERATSPTGQQGEAAGRCVWGIKERQKMNTETLSDMFDRIERNLIALLERD